MSIDFYNNGAVTGYNRREVFTLAGQSLGLWRLAAAVPAVIGCSLCASGTALAAGRGSIRDTEIENLLRLYTTPLFRTANFKPNQIPIHIINDPTPNAFVSGGLQMFINTGLLISAQNYGEVLGVLSHELGHIVGGHLTRLRDRAEIAGAAGLITTAIGIPLAILSGSAEVLAGSIGLGSTISQRSILAFSREFEQAADQIAVDTLSKIGQDSRGLADFMLRLRQQENLRVASSSAYLRTHPLTDDRIDFFKDQLAKRKIENIERPGWQLALDRARGKIIGYTRPLEEVLRYYPLNRDDVEARYARSFAYMRASQTHKALEEIDILLRETPEDPFFNETKGDIYRLGGRGYEALKFYNKALKVLPWAALVRLSAAQAVLDVKDQSLFPETRDSLYKAIGYEQKNPLLWQLLGQTQYLLGEQGLSTYAQAESAYLQGDTKRAESLALRAQKLLPETDNYQFRLREILENIKDKT